MKSISKFILALAVSLFAIAASPENVSAADTALQGTVLSGEGGDKAAIAGATVSIYQFQSGNATKLASGASNSSGKFSVSLTVDTGGGVLYAVARKGRIELIAAPRQSRGGTVTRGLHQSGFSAIMLVYGRPDSS